MDERLIIAAAVALLSVGVYLGFKLMHRTRLARKAPDLPRGWQPGAPGILYFASRTCTPCRAQGRAVEKIGEGTDRTLNLVKIDVDGDPELAGDWDVITVPTTVVLDSGGRIHTINHGAASEEKLRRQLEGVS